MDLAKELDWLDGLLDGLLLRDNSTSRNRADKLLTELRNVAQGPYKDVVTGKETTCSSDNGPSLQFPHMNMERANQIKEEMSHVEKVLLHPEGCTCKDCKLLRLDCKLMNHDPASAKETFEENKELLEKMSHIKRVIYNATYRSFSHSESCTCRDCKTKHGE